MNAANLVRVPRGQDSALCVAACHVLLNMIFYGHVVFVLLLHFFFLEVDV